MTGGSIGEERLRETLNVLASQVQPQPDAYRQARADWKRRERRRRLVLATLVTIVFALANIIGLWALNQTPSQPQVIFNGPVPTQVHTPAPVLRP
ncbi:hypothetical protein ACWGH8_03770 [Nonomuraea muscovyensis]|uniref:Nitrogen fixation/metabolism regulation signal transduction histidine kinase n=1 Tax=Nonomuraea muscovyensis TaxID=1124761 RepID=A0A7X0C9H4_9ACTN|nr:hypothetical protein [Nonomuraea muscovyensis]MBB6351040.1 nitrogen fixation/metabolism regulation signal transduction histidine kinase [Nonomuraea muscovyensis]